MQCTHYLNVNCPLSLRSKGRERILGKGCFPLKISDLVFYVCALAPGTTKFSNGLHICAIL